MVETWRLDALAKARAAKLQPIDMRSIKAAAAKWEAARLADLFEDEVANPASYAKRVVPVPADGVCTHCRAANALDYRTDHFGQYVSCLQCGTDWFPDAEPVPAIKTGHIGSRNGRHTPGVLVGDGIDEYQSQYKALTKRQKRERERNATT